MNTNDLSPIEEYIKGHIDKEDDYLYQLYRQTNIKLLRPRMASGHIQGVLLKMLVSMIRPQRILEIGTYTGYSALSMAAALPDDGLLYTFEINDEQEAFTRPWFEKSEYANKIKFFIGSVITLLPQMAINDPSLMFDLVFMDGNKREYIDYYELSLKYLNPGGFIFADNTLWDGHIIDPAYDNDRQTIGIKKFNAYVANDARVEKMILPIRDGLSLIRLK